MADDITFEDEEGNVKDKIDKLRKSFKECQKEKKEYLDGWKRSKAEHINYTKNQDKIFKRDLDLRFANFIDNVLPVFDSVLLALKVESDNIGISSIKMQFDQLFTTMNIEILEPKVGDKFDPHKHESIEEEEVSDAKKDNTIANVIRIGAKYNDYIIRAPIVKIYIHKK